MKNKHSAGYIFLLCLTFAFTCGMRALPAEVKYTSMPEKEPQEGAVARIIFFSDVTCEECQEMKAKILPKLLKKYPARIAVRIYEINDTASFVLLTRFEKRYGKAKNEVPIIFMDGKVRSGYEEEVKKSLEPDIKQALAKGGSPWSEPAPPEKNVTETETGKNLLESLTLIAIIGAAFADGINPCAFTTIIFLISYLSLIGRKKSDILKTGLIYTAAVFATYLALGLGLKFIISHMVNTRIAKKIIYGATGMVALGVAYLSLKDYLLARKGQYSDMTLKLSDDMQRRIRQSIHDKVRNLGIMTAALVLGILVALFELPCTGQMYFPIVTALTNPHLRSRALPYLILYNVVFIVPLIIVFSVAYYGVASQTIGERFKRHVGTIKIIMGIIFLLLAAILFYMALT